jgi:hypothetical protein
MTATGGERSFASTHLGGGVAPFADLPALARIGSFKPNRTFGAMALDAIGP